MIEIGADELKVLNCLVHAEQSATVIAETGMSEKVVIDIIRYLHHYRFIKAVDENGKELPMFEIDKIRKVRFILSSKGYSVLENPDTFAV